MKFKVRLGWVLLCAGLFSPLFARLGEWHVHPSFSAIRDLTCHKGLIYAATSGGLLVIKPSVPSVETYTLNDGLGGLGVSAAAVDTATGKVYLGMDNGNITVFRNGAFRVYTDFNSQPRIRFNKLYVYKGVLLIATNEGLSLFAENEGSNPVVYPTFNKFGTSKFFNADPEVRDVFVRQDTICILNRYFWGKLKLRWDPPILTSNAGLNLNLPGIWQTNGETGEFAYQTVHPDSTRDTIGYRHFYLKANALVGSLDLDLFEDPRGSLYALNVRGDTAFVHGLRGPAVGTLPPQGDTLFFPKALAGTSGYQCLAVDAAGKLYAGTDRRGVYMPVDRRSFWDGQDIPFVTAQKVRVDLYGNVYYTTRFFPGSASENQLVNFGIVKFDGARWTYLYPGAFTFTPAGVNEFIFDPYGRLLLTHSTEETAVGGWSSGVVAFDNPFLNAPVDVNGTRFAPGDSTNLNYNGSILSTPHIPTALTYDPAGRIYVAQSYFDSSNALYGRIGIYRDFSSNPVGSAGRFTVNQSRWQGNGPAAGLRRLGLVEFGPNVPGAITFDGQYNNLAIDRAGNIWALQRDIEKFDVFGLRPALSTADTMVYDLNNNIKGSLWQSGREGIPDSKRGLLATLDSKSARVIKADLRGDVWFGTSSGLFYYSEGRDTLNYGNVDGLWRYFLSGIAINDFDFDSLNNVWIATDKFGLKVLDYTTARYYADTRDYGEDKRDDIKIESFTESEGLLEDQVLSVAVHRKSGKVWLGFTEGLQEFESGYGFSQNLAKGYVFPVLVRGRNTPLLLNTLENGSRVDIYTLSGNLLHTQTLGKNHFRTLWDTKNPSGHYVATGVYLYKFTSPSKKTKTGKFAVVR